MKTTPVEVNTVCGNKDNALTIGRVIVAARLAACYHVDKIETCYWWQGNLKDAVEYKLKFLTLEKHVDAILEKIREYHTYELPAIWAMEFVGGEDGFIRWIESETRS